MTFIFCFNISAFSNEALNNRRVTFFTYKNRYLSFTSILAHFSIGYWTIGRWQFQQVRRRVSCSDLSFASISTLFNKVLNNLKITISTCFMKRSFLLIIFCFQISTFFNKILNNCNMTQITCKMKRSIGKKFINRLRNVFFLENICDKFSFVVFICIKEYWLIMIFLIIISSSLFNGILNNWKTTCLKCKMKKSPLILRFYFNISTFFNRILNNWKIIPITCNMKRS